jgi:hypothetical protein
MTMLKHYHSDMNHALEIRMPLQKTHWNLEKSGKICMILTKSATFESLIENPWIQGIPWKFSSLMHWKKENRDRESRLLFFEKSCFGKKFQRIKLKFFFFHGKPIDLQSRSFWPKIIITVCSAHSEITWGWLYYCIRIDGTAFRKHTFN